MRHACMLGFVGIAALAIAGGAWAAGEDVATITRLSQMFSDASASGNAKVLDSLLDDNVVFMGEDGSLSSKHAILTSAAPSPQGVHNKLVQSDFHVTLHGDVAVTSFTDNATFDTFGQVVHDGFRSTEVWLREDGGWKMISSQTIEVPVDPPAIRLPTGGLDQYVGTYQLAAGHAITIRRQGDGLVAVGHDNKPAPLLAETPDVMFRRDLPRIRFVFDRDAAGDVVGFDVRRAGHTMQHFTRV